MTKEKRKTASLNTASLIPLYRLAVVPVMIMSLIFEWRLLTAWVLLASFLSQAAGGFATHKERIEASPGGILHYVGDTVTGLLGLVAFIAFETQYFLEHLSIVVIAVVLSLVQTVLAFYRFGQPTAFHTYLAKTTAAFVAFFLFVSILIGPFDLLFYLAFITAMLGSLEEIAITFFLQRPEENVKGLYWLLKRPTLKFH